MDPRYEALYNIIADYKIIDETPQIQYNFFGTWAMKHFSDVCTLGDKHIQELLNEVWDLKMKVIDMEDIQCNDEDHCRMVEYILDAYNDRFCKGKFPKPNWAS